MGIWGPIPDHITIFLNIHSTAEQSTNPLGLCCFGSAVTVRVDSFQLFQQGVNEEYANYRRKRKCKNPVMVQAGIRNAMMEVVSMNVPGESERERRDQLQQVTTRCWAKVSSLPALAASALPPPASPSSLATAPSARRSPVIALTHC